jgi:hypothetical protein
MYLLKATHVGNYRNVKEQCLGPKWTRCRSEQRFGQGRREFAFRKLLLMILAILAFSNERLFHVCSRGRLETNSVAVEVESAAGRRLCVFRDGLRERVARFFKRILARDGLRVPVKELALHVDV